VQSGRSLELYFILFLATWYRKDTPPTLNYKLNAGTKIKFNRSNSNVEKKWESKLIHTGTNHTEE
jgi:hypothetical protein